MAIGIGSSWNDDSDDWDRKIGPMSSWLEDKNEIVLAKISFTDVQNDMCRKLRLETGIGLMNAKRCLEHYHWNFEKGKKHYREFHWDGKL